MIILGINCYHANSSAALVVDGKLVFAIEEERLNRIKNSGGFPYLSIEECLKKGKIKLSEVDYIATNSNPRKFFLKKLFLLLKNPVNIRELFLKSKNILNKLKINNELDKLKNLGNFSGKIVNIEHHLSHIASSYHISNFNKACGVSVDGSGDFTTTSNSVCINGNIEMKDRIFYPHSLGIFYTALSNFLGFDLYGEEYKVMALGAYGNSSLDSKLEELIHINNYGKFNLNLNYFLHHKNVNTFKIVNNEIVISKLLNESLVEDLLGFKKRNRNEELKTNHFNLAKSLQNLFEKAYFNYINFTYDKFQIENLCIAGGCAMNSLANGKILKQTKFKDIFVQPAAYDAGGAIGAALECANQNNQKIFKEKNLKLYLGPDYSNKYIEEILKIKKNELLTENVETKFSNDDKLIETTVSLLEKKNIIGIFRDRLEWGARALGNRSIIADPRGNDVKDMINSKIKRRESFRPFAPMILYDYLKDWFHLDREINSMMEVHEIVEKKKDIIPAVVHKDKTCRLQTITKKDNEFIYKLLKSFHDKTKIPILLNTSFNENEPIVCRPEEAIDTFLRVDMDALILQNFILTKKK